jgi:hypothetical protein
MTEAIWGPFKEQASNADETVHQFTLRKKPK